MARLRPNVSEFLFIHPETGQQLLVRSGEEIPQWALDVYSNPRVIELEPEADQFEPEK